MRKDGLDLENVLEKVKERFLKYVQIDTQSKVDSPTYPSTSGQLDFAAILAQECREIGLSDVVLEEKGYVTATLESNAEGNPPVIGFIAHMDTSPESSGKGVSPKVTENYDGSDIPLKSGISLSPREFPDLKKYVGQEIITADGDTLLGADDKAGVAEIMVAMEHLIAHPEIKHGKIRIAFTPDEEVGHGIEHFDVAKFNADFGYTLDGGELGELEAENFNAARAVVEFKGKSVHPGTAKGIMVNAALLAGELIHMLPLDETPAATEGYEGFYHVVSVEGAVESAKVDIILRDFDPEGLEARKAKINEIAATLREMWPKAKVSVAISNQYSNMAEPLKDKQEIVELAVKAMEEAGVKPIRKAIRGGTDGAMLSYAGLPCPNIFTGGHNFHGPYEYIPTQSMVKAVETVVAISRLGAKL
jgi:tripeptide aminopeptidase